MQTLARTRELVVASERQILRGLAGLLGFAVGVGPDDVPSADVCAITGDAASAMAAIIEAERTSMKISDLCDAPV
ncbi:hypothetical protein [uncultured Bradyrhizobium sp.]|uniref:hypothetical protein n=1 Tax=unclassified Sphingomonas TaxID=196159 RepID=UPI00263822A5|nr:hypothetical protein [uncultured Bradyrhizobium sp.]